MPVYQGVAYLAEAVQSVLAQTHSHFELLIGDDGSTDGSRAYLATLTDARVRTFEFGKRVGLFKNLNRLLARASSPIVRVLCQDDVLEETCLEQELSFLAGHPEVGMVISKYREMGTRSQILSGALEKDLPDVLVPMLATQQFYYHGCIAGNLSTVSIRKQVLEDVGVFDESYKVSGDYDLWSRVSSKYAVGIIHQHLVRIRTHDRQLSRAAQSSVPFVIENARVRQTLFPRLPRQAQSAARRFEHRRHCVLDFHLALRSFLAGRFIDAWKIVRILGVWGSVRAFGHWAWTRNNRLRPQAPWVLPESQSA